MEETRDEKEGEEEEEGALENQLRTPPLEAFNVQIFSPHAHRGGRSKRASLWVCVFVARPRLPGASRGMSTELWLSSQISPAFDGGDSPQSGARPNSAPLFLLQGEKFTAGSLL